MFKTRLSELRPLRANSLSLLRAESEPVLFGVRPTARPSFSLLLELLISSSSSSSSLRLLAERTLYVENCRSAPDRLGMNLSPPPGVFIDLGVRIIRRRGVPRGVERVLGDLPPLRSEPPVAAADTVDAALPSRCRHLPLLVGVLKTVAERSDGNSGDEDMTCVQLCLKR